MMLLGVLSSQAQNNVSGTVYFDSDENCMIGALEQKMMNWPVSLRNGTQVYYALTNGEGYFSFNVPNGNYDLQPFPLSPSLFVPAVCSSLNGLNISGGSNQTINVPVFEELGCSELMVDLVMSATEPGDTGRLYVSYLNSGSVPYDSASVYLQLGNAFNAPENLNQWQSFQQTDYIVIPVDSVPVGSQQVIEDVVVVVDVDIPFNQNLYADLSAPADVNCFAPVAWDSSNVVVYGECIQGDSTYFKIKNLGPGDMASSAGYIIVEDDLLVIDSDQYQLNSGDSIELKFHNPNAYYRLNANQTPGNPILGEQTYLVDVCAGVSATQIVPGDIYVEDLTVSNQILTHSTQPFMEEAMLEVYPVGIFCGTREILTTDRVDFVLRARNLTLDENLPVSFTMPIPEELSFESFRPGAASSAYVLSLVNNSLVWNLADSLSAFGAPNGDDQAIVKFSMTPDTATSSASILDSYFEVTIGSQTFISSIVSQTLVDSLCVSVDAAEPIDGSDDVLLVPNPAFNSFSIATAEEVREVQLITLDGRTVIVSSNPKMMDVSSLPNGIYIVAIQTANGRLRKKLVVQR